MLMLYKQRWHYKSPHWEFKADAYEYITNITQTLFIPLRRYHDLNSKMYAGLMIIVDCHTAFRLS